MKNQLSFKIGDRVKLVANRAESKNKIGHVGEVLRIRPFDDLDGGLYWVGPKIPTRDLITGYWSFPSDLAPADPVKIEDMV